MIDRYTLDSKTLKDLTHPRMFYDDFYVLEKLKESGEIQNINFCASKSPYSLLAHGLHASQNVRDGVLFELQLALGRKFLLDKVSFLLLYDTCSISLF